MPDFCSFIQPSNLTLRLIHFRILISVKKITFNENDEIIEDSKENNKETFYDRYGLFDQLTINDYLPGQGIPPHVDTHSPFQELFASLSLKSGITMTFKNPDN